MVDTKPSLVQQAYDSWSGTYDSQLNRTRDLDLQVVNRHLPLFQDRDIVEIGCGTGKNTAVLADVARKVLALDFSAGMLSVARQLITSPVVTFQQTNLLESWPCADLSADTVMGNLVLEHVADLRPVMQEAARVLRPGGWLLISELHPYRQLAGAQAHFQDGSTGEQVLVPAYYHGFSDHVNAIIQAGLTIERIDEWHDVPGEGLPRLLSILAHR